MSGYRPWVPAEPELVPPELVESDEAPDGATQGYVPWAPGLAPATTHVAAKRFEAPPGLGDAPPRRKGDHAHETAAATLLWTGGFLLVGSIMFMAVMTLAIDFEALDARYEGHQDPDVPIMITVRAYGGWGIFASMLYLAPGVGLLYHQAWARPVGFIAASLALIMVPVGLILGIIGLVNLSRMEAA